MTRYLLDTHVLLWWLSGPGELTAAARNAIADGTNVVFLSSAAVWEMAIKKRLGRLSFPSNLEEVLRADRIEVLPIGLQHALGVSDLPLIHQDPFDRLMVCQARIEGLTLVTRDAVLAQYDVGILNA